MKRGWGYKANRRSQIQKAIDGLSIKFENEQLKVYESLDNLFYGGKLSIRILFNKEKKSIKVILTGKDMTGARVKPIEEYVTDLKSLKNIKEYVSSYLINKFSNSMIGCAKKEIEEMTDKQFQEELNRFINNDIKDMSKEKVSNTWSRFYNDMFERSSMYDDFEIAIIHEKYLKAVSNI